MLHSTDSCRISGPLILARSPDVSVAADDFETSDQAVGKYDAKLIIGFAIVFGVLVAVIVIVAVCVCLRWRERFGSHKDVDPNSPCSIDLPIQMPGPEDEDYRGYQFTLLRQPSAETARADRNDDKWPSGDGTVIMFPRDPLSNDADGQRRNLKRPSRGRPRRWTVQEMR